MTLTKQLSIGFVGVGSMGQSAHLKNFAILPDCKIVALAEPRPALGKSVSRKYAIPRTYGDAQEMLDHEDLDGIVAIQPFNRNLQIVAPLYNAGIPILSEKPLAASVEIGGRMVEALSQTTAQHFVGYHKRSDPASVRARATIRELRSRGTLGDLQYVRVTMPPGDWVQGGFNDLLSSDEPVPPTSPDADVDPAYLSFINYYIHQVNLIRFLLDESYQVTFADENGLLLGGRSDSGVTVLLEMAPWQQEVGWNETALTCFERGWVKLDLPAPLASHVSGTVSIFGDTSDSGAPRLITHPPEPTHAMLAQASAFLAAIRGQETQLCPAHDAVIDLDIAAQYMNLRGVQVAC